MELLKVHFAKQEALVSHANAALTPRARLRVAQLVVDHGESIPEVGARFQCSYTTVKRWASRYAAGESMQDRSSRPHTMPAKTCPAVTKRIVSLRLRKRLGPVQLAAHVGVAPSTVHRVLTRCRLNRLAHVDRATGEPVRRYEHPHPGSMLHVDVKKLGNIPDGGGWRYVGRVQGKRNRAATAGKPKNVHRDPKMGTAFVHRLPPSRSGALGVPNTCPIRAHSVPHKGHIVSTQGNSTAAQHGENPLVRAGFRSCPRQDSNLRHLL